MKKAKTEIQTKTTATAAAQPKMPDDDTLVFAPVDERVKYPSYKSFDEFIDVERLRALDGYIMQRIKRRLRERRGDYKFYTGPYKLNRAVADRPGSRMITWPNRNCPTAISTSTGRKSGI
jgi:hypothetical protein